LAEVASADIADNSIVTADIADEAVASVDIAGATITNSDIAAAAGIATSKLSGAVTAVAGHGLGALASLSAVSSGEITDGTVMNADISGSAQVATSKLSGPVTSITGHGLGALATLGTVNASTITDEAIGNADIAATAAIPTSKLSGALTAVSEHGLGSFATLTVAPGSSGNVLYSDGSSWVGGASPLTGTAGGDLSGSYPYPTVATIGGRTVASIVQGVDRATNATSSSTSSTVVKRDASGNFAAGTITASLNGNVTGTAANVTGTIATANGGTGATSATQARSNLGMGTVAPLNTGTSASNILQLDGSGKLPAVDGSQLTNILLPGMVAAFRLNACPSGWSKLTSAEGRYVLGMPSGGTLDAVVGTALTNLENRASGQHTHAVTDPGHSHSYFVRGYRSNGMDNSTHYPFADGNGSTQTSGSSTTGVSLQNSGTVAGTNAPYIQLLYCEKV
jgi:hypothetical protein